MVRAGDSKPVLSPPLPVFPTFAKPNFLGKSLLCRPATIAILPLPYLRRGANAVDESARSTGHWLDCPTQAASGLAFAVILLGLTGCGGFSAQARNAEGVRLFQQARYQEATKQFQEATYADPNNADAYYNLAATYHRIGKTEHRQADLDQAETYYNLCLDRQADHTDCYRGLAVLLAEQGRNDEAFRLVEGWVQRQPGSADAKIELARLNDEFGNRQAAREHLIEALAAQPDNPRALTALGKIREESGENVQALANYQRSLWHDNRQPQVAARVTALQTGTTAGTAAGVTAPPAVSLGTRTADRAPAPLQ
jgi:tetratricopeptide (TPR) repeat protein